MEGPGDDEVLVLIIASGICHTDIDCSMMSASLFEERSDLFDVASPLLNEPAERGDYFADR